MCIREGSHNIISRWRSLAVVSFSFVCLILWLSESGRSDIEIWVPVKTKTSRDGLRLTDIVSCQRSKYPRGGEY